jgi:hypothetical protein
VKHPVGKNKRFERRLDDSNSVVKEDRIEWILDALWLGGPDWTARRDENAWASSPASWLLIVGNSSSIAWIRRGRFKLSSAPVMVTVFSLMKTYGDGMAMIRGIFSGEVVGVRVLNSERRRLC